MTTGDLTKGSKDGKTAPDASELKSELEIIFPKSSVYAFVGVIFGLISSGIMMALSLRLLGKLTFFCVLLNYWGMFAALYFSVHLDLEEAFKIRRWCRKKLIQFSVILPGLDRSRINKVVFLLEQEEEHRYLSRRTTKDAALTELEWELKIIFEENSFYATVHAGLCISFLLITVLLGGALSERSSIYLQMWFMSWFWILFWASAANYNLRGPLDLEERDKWLREKIVACSVMLPYQDRSRINKALLLMEKKEEEEERLKVEQQQQHSKV